MSSDRGLRLPDAGFDVVVRILRAYFAAAKGRAGVPVKLDDVVRRAGGSRTQVSGQNAFLASLGLIQGGNTKQLTEIGRRLALAVDHPESGDWTDAWTEAVLQSEDLVGIVDSVQVRQEMTTDALLSHIVLTVGVAKNNRSLTGARTVIEVLKAAGVLAESDGTFRATVVDSDHPSPSRELARQDLAASPSASAPVIERAPADLPIGASAKRQVHVHVHIWVDAKDAASEDVTERVQALIESLTTDED